MFRRSVLAPLALAVAVGSITIVVAAQQPRTPSTRTEAAIRLRATTFTPTRGETPGISRALTIAGYAPGQRGYYLVQFQGPVLDSWKADVTALGAELLEYVPDFAFKVRMTSEQATRVEQAPSVAWVGLFHPGYKLRPDLVRNGRHAYSVRVERGADAAAAAAAIAATGAQVLFRNGSTIGVAAAGHQLDAIAHVLDVAAVENFVLRKKHNEYGGGVILSAQLANGNGYDGSTQTIAIADTGFRGGIPDDAYTDLPPSRIAAIFNWPGSTNGCFTSIVDDGAADVDTGHGSHTVISALGSGGPGGEGRGTAPAGRLVLQAVENWATTSVLCQVLYGAYPGYYLVGIPNDIRALFQQGYDAGARVHSDSWGADAAGAYTTDSASVDDFVWNHRDMTITFSAGNAGVDADADSAVDFGSIAAPATAKNVISVGASENDRASHWECDQSLVYTNCAAQGGQNNIFTYGSTWPSRYPANPLKDDPSAGSAEQMAAFSSRGPADDGRIKPDVVAPGTWVLSGYSNEFRQQYDPSPNPQDGLYQYDGWGYPLNQYYKYLGGTSMSNPLVAGGAAVVRDYYLKTADHDASAALVKATLVNSAVDLADEDNDGVNDNAYPIPNNHEGWGRVNLANATDGGSQFIDEPTGLSTSTSAVYAFPVSVDGSPLKISLAWSDFPSTPSASKNLVNDLDLTVTAPDGVTTYHGNVFAGGWSQVGGDADRTNNLENVYVASASAGAWTVEVAGYNVPEGPQPFALVVRGSLGGSAIALPHVSVTVVDGVATEAGETSGILSVVRTGDTAAALTVHYALTGTATERSDYAPLAGVVAIPAGASDAPVVIHAIDDGLVEPDETVVLTLISDGTYALGFPSSGSTTIVSDDQPPDLVVSAVSAPPIAGAGVTISVTDTTFNSGPGPSTPSSTAFYLSVNTLRDATDVLIGSRAVPALAAGAGDTASTDLQIPSDTATRTYYVLAVADADGTNAETKETNNTRSSSGVKIGPDLIVPAVAVPAAAGAGDHIVVSDTIHNQGGGASIASTTRLYLSGNLSLDAADVALGERTVQPLAAGASDTATTAVTIPGTVGAGTYYILAQADATGTVLETSETNNVKASSSIKIGSDLVVSAVTVPSTGGAGEKITVSDTTKNQGSGGASESVTAFYLSLNPSLDGSDVRLGGRYVLPLGSGQTDMASTSVMIPNGTPTGSYYLLAVADADGAVAETSETNNVKLGLPVKVGPDLAVSALTSPSTAVAGTSITAADTTKNQGGGAASSSATSFYLSSNLTLDPSDTLLGMRGVGPLGAGLSESGSLALPIPGSTPAGTYYIIAAADGDNAVAETVETNNTRVRSIRISAPAN